MPSTPRIRVAWGRRITISWDPRLVRGPRSLSGTLEHQRLGPRRSVTACDLRRISISSRWTTTARTFRSGRLLGTLGRHRVEPPECHRLGLPERHGLGLPGH